MSEFYYIRNSKSLDQDYCLIDQAPQEVQWLSSCLSSGKSAKAEYPEYIKVTMSNRGGKRLSDFITNNENLLIVSQRIKSVIESVNHGPVESLPVSILDHQGQIASKDYFYINPLGHYDCLDHLHSKIDYFKGTEKIARAERIVLCSEKIRQVPDLFRIKNLPQKYIISKKMLEHIHAIHPAVSNLVVDPVDLSVAESLQEAVI